MTLPIEVFAKSLLFFAILLIYLDNVVIKMIVVLFVVKTK